MKRFFSVLVTVIVLSMCFSSCQSEEKTEEIAEEVVPSTIHIYTTDESFENKLEYVWFKHQDWKERVEVVVLPKEGYAQAIDNLFLGPQSVEQSEETEGQEPQEYKYPDIIIVDSTDLSHFVTSDDTIAVNELGLKEDDFAQMYEYTLKVATTDDGTLKGLTWKVNPGAFIYRKSLAMDILGFDDEDNVQSYLKDWDTFVDTARVINKKTSGSIKMLDKVDLDNMEYDISAIDMTDKNYFSSVNLGKVFGYFCSADMFSKFDEVCKGSSRGDFAVCKGPQSFVGDGAWIMATKKCADKELAGKIMKALCAESDIQKKIFENDNEFVNNRRQMSNAYNSGKGKLEVLGGGDYISVYDKVAAKVGQE